MKDAVILNQKIILHIPHSSTHIPSKEGFVVGQDVLDLDILKLTDWYTDDLFYSAEDEMVVADFSRVFCDPERFPDDAQEVMAKYGMGVLYEKSDEGKILRKVTAALKQKVLENYYWVHHNKFNQAVRQQLDVYGKAVIIDCHSYPSHAFVRDLNQSPNRPDFNIGTDAYHTPQKLIDLSVDFFHKAAYSLGINEPYSGSIVPLEYYQKNKKVETIMLEINRRLYLKEPSNEKSVNYEEVKKITKAFINCIRTSL